MRKILVLVFLKRSEAIPSHIKFILRLIRLNKSQPRVINILDLVDRNIKFIRHINQSSKLIITGSAYNTLHHNRISETTKKMISLVQNILLNFSNKPVLGLCYGIQLLTILNGGRITYNRAKLRNSGFKSIEIDNKTPIFKNLPLYIDVDFNHKFSIKLRDVPKNYKIIGIGQNLVTGISHLTKPHFGLLFHPERSGLIGTKILDNFINFNH